MGLFDKLFDIFEKRAARKQEEALARETVIVTNWPTKTESNLEAVAEKTEPVPTPAPTSTPEVVEEIKAIAEPAANVEVAPQPPAEVVPETPVPILAEIPKAEQTWTEWPTNQPLPSTTPTPVVDEDLDRKQKKTNKKPPKGAKKKT